MKNSKERIVIRIGQRHLSFSSFDTDNADQPVNYEPYVVKSGMSMAANLREALKGAGLAKMGVNRAMVMIDTPALLVPVEIFEEEKMAVMYNQSFPHKEQELVLYNVLPDLNAVAVFAMNKDLKTVLDDNFSDLRISAAMSPVWRHLHRRSFTGARAKLYGYLHDQTLDVFAFQQNRFKFCNHFEAGRTQDIIYFLLYVWKQLMLHADQDELHLIGDGLTEGPDDLVAELHRYLKNVYVVNPSADFNRAAVTRIKGMPFDLMALLARGM